MNAKTALLFLTVILVAYALAPGCSESRTPEPPVQADAVRCPNCGNMVLESADKCRFCGHRMVEEEGEGVVGIYKEASPQDPWKIANPPGWTPVVTDGKPGEALPDERIEVALPYYNWACALAVKGDKEKALEKLGKAFEYAPSLRKRAREDKNFMHYRNDPVFKKLTRE
jgi:predicted RNA-binding Zn-ribbon protein involved in translation (DUF1610 family)